MEMRPAACTASAWTSAPRAWATRAISARGWDHPGFIVGKHDRDDDAAPGFARLFQLRQHGIDRRRIDAPQAVDTDTQCIGARGQHAVMLNQRCDDPAAGKGTQGKVVGLRTTAGKDNAGLVAADQRRDPGACYLHHRTGCAAGLMHRRGIAGRSMASITASRTCGRIGALAL